MPPPGSGFSLLQVTLPSSAVVHLELHVEAGGQGGGAVAGEPGLAGAGHGGDEPGGDVDPADAVVAGVGDEHVAGGVQGDRLGLVQQGGLGVGAVALHAGAGADKHGHAAGLGVQAADLVVVPGGDQHRAVERREGDVGGVVELDVAAGGALGLHVALVAGAVAGQVVAHHGLDQAVGGDPADPVVLPVEQVRRCRRWGRSRGPSASTARSPGGRARRRCTPSRRRPPRCRWSAIRYRDRRGPRGPWCPHRRRAAARPPTPRRAARRAPEVSISCRQPAARSWPSCRTPREPRQLTPSPPPTLNLPRPEHATHVTPAPGKPVREP